MSCIQATSVGKPCVTLPNRSQLQRVPGTTHGTLLKLTYKQCAPRLKSWQGSTVVCLFGDKDKSEDTDGNVLQLVGISNPYELVKGLGLWLPFVRYSLGYLLEEMPLFSSATQRLS
ncbi:hypothetical protein Pint_26060 [Pistacia integerrima]|uniref:Uncharacterized protein n=1 Tax=Pistacia integerrima TaxID=434235 RepID=A0ACC0YDQ1_9ROSI|nr:hypothetical protein Pint_26060 [Pistacia integerrima]